MLDMYKIIHVFLYKDKKLKSPSYPCPQFIGITFSSHFPCPSNNCSYFLNKRSEFLCVYTSKYE